MLIMPTVSALRSFCLVLLLGGGLTACAGAQPTDLPDAATIQALEATIDALVEEEMAATHLPGVAVVVVQNGQTLIKRGYGVADAVTDRPVDPDRTLFRIGSVSKALTALALTRLIDDGRVGVEDDVTQYYSDIPNPNGYVEPVRIWNLLTHTSGFDQVGLNRHVWEIERSLEERKAMRPSLALFLADDNLRRVTPPGLHFRYDTYGITLAGEILGRVTGLGYAEAMRQEMFTPLGMTRSFVEVDDAHREDLAIGHGWVNGRFERQPYEVYMTTPASSIDATPADMGRLLEALTSDGANAHGRFYSEAMLETVLSPQFRPHPRFTGASHGLWEYQPMDFPDRLNVRSLEHGGSMLGFQTVFAIMPEANLGMFIVTNRNSEAGGGRVNLGARLTPVILDALHGPIEPHDVAKAVPLGDRDLKEYAGPYVNGTFCHSCTQDEYARGGWTMWGIRPVTLSDQGLSIRDTEYLPTAEPDVFVQRDGVDEVFFGRDDTGQVAFYTLTFGPMAFERMPALAQVEEGMEQAEHQVEQGQTAAARRTLTQALQLALDNGVQSEGGINALGYEYLQADNLPMALLVFQFNTRAFPDSWNVHDSYGEALALDGNTDAAIAAYQRSLDLNPDSETGQAALTRLLGQ
ncbi:MAG: hypothetical protein RhofKO_28730 [Rhodothermales bacterium]